MTDFSTTFYVIEKLAAICATPGIDEDTQKIANEQIRNLLEIVKKDVNLMTAKSSGLVV
jgi:hypothetical protein